MNQKYFCNGKENVATELWSSVMLHLIYNNILMKPEETDDYFTLL